MRACSQQIFLVLRQQNSFHWPNHACVHFSRFENHFKASREGSFGKRARTIPVNVYRQVLS